MTSSSPPTDDENLQDLVTTIAQKGLIQPIAVRLDKNFAVNAPAKADERGERIIDGYRVERRCRRRIQGYVKAIDSGTTRNGSRSTCRTSSSPSAEVRAQLQIKLRCILDEIDRRDAPSAAELDAVMVRSAVSADKTRMKTHQKPAIKTISALCYLLGEFFGDFFGGASTSNRQCFQRSAAPPLTRFNTRFTTRFGSRSRPPKQGENQGGGRDRDPVRKLITTRSRAGQQNQSTIN